MLRVDKKETVRTEDLFKGYHIKGHPPKIHREVAFKSDYLCA